MTSSSSHSGLGFATPLAFRQKGIALGKSNSAVCDAARKVCNHRRRLCAPKMAADGDFGLPRILPLQKGITSIRPRTTKRMSIPFDNLVIRNWRPRDRFDCISLIGNVLKEYGLEWDPKGADKDVTYVEQEYSIGEFWVVEDPATLKIVGTAAFYEVPQRGNGIVEIRKMYLAKEVRGRGLGSFLLSALEQRCVQLGYKMAIIETASCLKEACELYNNHGYVPSTGIETDRCDVVLEKLLQLAVPPSGEDHVEVVDYTNGWTVTCVSRRFSFKHRILFRAVVVLIESGGMVLIHKRSMKKSTYPGRISPVITGCGDWMEVPLTTAKREVEEEVGLRNLSFAEAFPSFLPTKRDDPNGQRILFHPFIATGEFSAKDIVCDPNEVDAAWLMSRKDAIAEGIGGPLWTEFRSRGL